MVDWLRLLATSLLFGAGIVWGMVLPRRGALASTLAAAASLVVAGSAVGSISERYQTPEAIVASLFFLVAGGATGYSLSAAALPLLALTRRSALVSDPARSPLDAIVLLACTDPERYDPRAVAAQGADLARTSSIDVPLGATPFVYLAEKTRYRALGGHSPGAVLAGMLRDEVARALEDRSPGLRVLLAWSYSDPSLVRGIEALVQDGAGTIGVVVLGAEDSVAVDRAKSDLDSSCAQRGTPAVAFGPSVWSDRGLPDRLVERVLEAVGADDRAGVGVVLVCPGQPLTPDNAHSAAAAEDTYFNQRVRMLLADAGLDEQLIRVAWLEWQQPDVTDAARHLAALGCARILVVPSTIVLPSVSTALDMRHAIELARLPQGVAATTLPPWGDDPAMVRAVAESAMGALESLRPPSDP